MQKLTPESVADFFNAHVLDLQGKDVFRTFDEPKGKSVEPALDFLRGPHWNNPEYAVGTTRAIGDMAYDFPISSALHLHSLAQVNQATVRLNTQSVQTAIAAYIPLPSFTSYLRYFAENLDDPDVQAYLQASLENCTQQLSAFTNTPETLRTPPEIVEKLLSYKNVKERAADPAIRQHLEKSSYFRFENGELNEERSLRVLEHLERSTHLQNASKHPELLLAMAIFQGAHIGWRAELKKAIQGQYDAGALSEEEYVNANAAVKGALRQLDSFLIFSSILPIILHEHNTLSSTQEGGVENNSDAMHNAIHRGWQRFDEARVLNSILSTAPAQGATKEEFQEKRLNMVCPAKAHLRSAKGVFEATFDSVMAHKEQLEPHLAYVADLANHTLNPWKDQKPETIFSVPPHATGEAFGYESSQWNLGEEYFTQGEMAQVIGAFKQVTNELKQEGKPPPSHALVSRLALTMKLYATGSLARPAPIDSKLGYIVAEGAVNAIEVSLLNIQKVCAVIEEQLERLPKDMASALRQEVRDALPERGKQFLPEAPSKFSVISVDAVALQKKTGLAAQLSENKEKKPPERCR